MLEIDTVDNPSSSVGLKPDDVGIDPTPLTLCRKPPIAEVTFNILSSLYPTTSKLKSFPPVAFLATIFNSTESTIKKLSVSANVSSFAVSKELLRPPKENAPLLNAVTDVGVSCLNFNCNFPELDMDVL